MGKICFIVGHGKSKTGGYDSGAVSGSFHEFKIAKDITKYAQEYYNQNYNEQCDLMNYDGDLYLTERIKKVNNADYDFVAEFHLNAGGGTGTECYYYHGSDTGKKYADKISKEISAALGIPQRSNGTDDGGDKVKLNNSGKDYFAIIRDTEPCAVLIETVFIDTASDLNTVKTDAGRKECGIAVAKAVASVRGASKKTANTSTNSAPKKESSAATTLKKGDAVTVVDGATYYGSVKAVPDWVKSNTWIVKSVSGDRVVIDKSLDGKESVNSAIHSKYLKLASNKTELTFKPYKVKVNTLILNIRKGPGTKYKIVGTIHDRGVYTIVEKNGNWGKLKSGAGWINLNYTKKQ